MGFIEELGEKAIGYVRNVIYHLLGAFIAILKGIQKATERLDRFSFFPFMERRGVELKDYLVLRAQVFTLGFLLLVVLYIFDKFTGLRFTVLGIALAGSAVVSALSLKEHFTDYAPYRDFFISYFGISVLLLIVKLVKPTLNLPFPYIHFVVIALAYIALFSYYFRTRYARDYTFGRVITGGDPMKVKVNYDITSSVKPGVHVLRNSVQAKEGDVVKLGVSKGFLNIKGSKITEALEVAKINPEKANVIK